MKIEAVMTRNVRTCRPESTLAEVVRDMWEADCGVLPVVGTDGRVVGMITDRDICIALATQGRTADRIAVREVARHLHVCTCLASDVTTTALKMMQEHQVHRLPVVDDEGHLQGIVSLNDIVMHKGAANATQIATALAGIYERRAAIGAPGAA
ncbi:MAG TPA: CBS domain-containing protein [Vicinamibacterales bacterium]|nr:CBS domain-containing protein [Vicinamibacterales bacterium]